MEDHLITLKDETFDGTFPFTPHYFDDNGFQMHYVDEGSGEPIVLVHGDPTWGYLYRNFIHALARHQRCILPDHMGMGKSGIPQEQYPYRLQHHIANFENLLLHLDLHDVTLVLHDWGGPVGLGFATRHQERVKRLVLMNTWAFAPWPGGPFPRLLEIIRSARPALLGTTFHIENLTQEVMDAYRAPFPTPASRLALLCWSRDIPISEADPSYAEMKRIERGLPEFLDTPTLLVWGMRDPVLSEPVLRTWQSIYPRAITYEIEDASHFLQEDAPARIVSCIEEFLAVNP